MWIIFAAAVVPGLLLLYYVYSKDFNPEPKRLIYKGFLYGALSVFVSTLISGPLLNLGLYTNNPATLLDAVKVSFFGAAIPEESAKLFMLWLLLRKCPEFDERYDGMVYAACVGLGFACVENLMYVLSSGAAWFYVSTTRALFAVPGHFAFAIAMGYYYSKNHFGWRRASGLDSLAGACAAPWYLRHPGVFVGPCRRVVRPYHHRPAVLLLPAVQGYPEPYPLRSRGRQDRSGPSLRRRRSIELTDR